MSRSDRMQVREGLRLSSVSASLRLWSPRAPYRRSLSDTSGSDSERALGGEATWVNGAVHDPEAARAVVDKAIEAYGRLDIVVNNAGTSAGPPVPEGPDEAIADQMAVHIYGSMRIVEAAWPHLIAAKRGCILNVGSAASFGFHCGMAGAGWNSAYPTAKAAPYGLTRQMAGAGTQRRFVFADPDGPVIMR